MSIAGLVYCLAVAVLVALGCLAYGLWGGWLELPSLPAKQLAVCGVLIWLGLCLFCPLYLKAWKSLAVGRAQALVGELAQTKDAAAEKDKRNDSAAIEVRERLRNTYGYFWRRHVRVLLVVGEPEEIEAIAPGLAAQHWQEGHGSVLLWGGALKEAWESQWPENLRKLSWRKPLDGVIWALTAEQAAREENFGEGVRRLHSLARTLRWQAPLYLWQVTRSDWQQDGHANAAVGCLLCAGAAPGQVENALRQLVVPLRERGVEHLEGGASRDFLLRLSRDLNGTGISLWQNTLTLFAGSFAHGVPLRGLLFSLPQKAGDAQRKHSWWPPPAWDAIRGDKQARGRMLGWGWLRGLYMVALGAAGLCLLALLLSFTSNRAQIATVETALETIGQPKDRDAQLMALNELTREIARLDYRREHGVPWYQRFGLSQNDALLESLWPRYAQANNQLMRDAATQHLEQQLSELAALPADSPERATRAEEAHAQLKAYLMMARPDKVDATFLTKQLIAEEPERPGVAPGLWQGISPNLWAFYAQHLSAHPEWRIEAKPELVGQARQVLLGQLGRRNGVANLYQQVLDRASNNYAAMTLMDMVGETDSACAG